MQTDPACIVVRCWESGAQVNIYVLRCAGEYNKYVSWQWIFHFKPNVNRHKKIENRCDNGICVHLRIYPFSALSSNLFLFHSKYVYLIFLFPERWTKHVKPSNVVTCVEFNNLIRFFNKNIFFLTIYSTERLKFVVRVFYWKKYELTKYGIYFRSYKMRWLKFSGRSMFGVCISKTALSVNRFWWSLFAASCSRSFSSNSKEMILRPIPFVVVGKNNIDWSVKASND